MAKKKKKPAKKATRKPAKKAAKKAAKKVARKKTVAKPVKKKKSRSVSKKKAVRTRAVRAVTTMETTVVAAVSFESTVREGNGDASPLDIVLPDTSPPEVISPPAIVRTHICVKKGNKFFCMRRLPDGTMVQDPTLPAFSTMAACQASCEENNG